MMKYSYLGNTNLEVSTICLGTMTWGEQNTEAQAHQQMDYALDHGVNFFDAAEMYPVPPKAETQGQTEAYIGSWFARSGNRERVTLASKVTGRSSNFSYLGRGSETRLNREQIMAALEGSLKRLQTDYIDLYQLHWPERKTNFFGELGYQHTDHDDAIALEETLAVLQEAQQAGKIRYIGLSNETPWGVMHSLRLHEDNGLPRVQSVQNPYNLLNRTYEVGLAEVSIRELCGLLAYSPLGFGVLSGKYRHGATPPNARLTMFERFQRYKTQAAAGAVEAYCDIAETHGLDPAQMALAYVNTRPFLTSNIIGATSMEQLKSNIDSVYVDLTPDVFEAIEAVHRRFPNPCP